MRKEGSRQAVCYLFVGPSGPGARALLGEDACFKVRPPIKRGDIPALRASESPGVLAIADGLFNAAPAVGHNEILLALRDGWKVYGLCSIGALRACEMVSYGVIPFGRVAQRYVDAPETPDDFVALLHGPEPAYLPMSEPYVHLEYFMAEACAAGILPEARSMEIAGQLTQCWYGERTLPRFRELLMEGSTAEQGERLSAMLEDFGRFRIKNLDLEAFLAERPWLEQTQMEGEGHG